MADRGLSFSREHVFLVIKTWGFVGKKLPVSKKL